MKHLQKTLQESQPGKSSCESKFVNLTAEEEHRLHGSDPLPTIGTDYKEVPAVTATLIGLRNKPELNGQQVMLTQFHRESGRYTAKLVPNAAINDNPSSPDNWASHDAAPVVLCVKPVNLILADETSIVVVGTCSGQYWCKTAETSAIRVS